MDAMTADRFWERAQSSAKERLRGSAGLAALVVLGLVAPTTVKAAREVGDLPPAMVLPLPQSSPIVLAIQSLLSELDLYHGSLDGRTSAALSDSIRLHQKGWGLSQDGRATEDLLQHLEMVVGMRRIDRRLGAAREEQIGAARRLLLEHPATRDLWREGKAAPSPAVGTDSALCLDDPSVRCLLSHALGAALRAPEGQMRDWALGDVVAVYAKAGWSGEALAAASGLADPRSLMAALEAIVRGLAESGDSDAALAALEVIPDAPRRADALLAVIQGQIEDHDSTRARENLRHLAGHVGGLTAPHLQVALLARMAELAARIGDADAAQDWIAEARHLLIGASAEMRAVGHAMIAASLAVLDRPVEAAGELERVDDALTRVAAQMALAESQLRAGQADQALLTLDRVESPRYRVVALCRLAIAMAASQGRDPASALLDQAAQAVDAIDLPFARAYAQSRLALARSEIGQIDQALAAAGRIEDPALRAQVYWTLHDGPQGQSVAQDLPEGAGRVIPDSFSRVWMFADLARARLKAGDREGATRHWRRALDSARPITDLWTRARAFAVLASLVIDLERFGRHQPR